MFSVTTGYKSQFNLTGSRFARKKRILYVGLTLRECILLLPKEIANYILEYLDPHNIFAMDRATKNDIRHALYISVRSGLIYHLQYLHLILTESNEDVRKNLGKIWRMNKEDMVKYVTERRISIEYWIISANFRKVIISLNRRARVIQDRQKKARKLSKQKKRDEINMAISKSMIHNGSIVRMQKISIETGIVVSHRDKSITMYCADDIVYIDGAINMNLTGKMKIVPYKYFRIIDVVNGEFILPDHRVIALSANYTTAELTSDEWANSKILLKRIKEII